MKKLLKPFDYVFILRPMYFLPLWSLYLAGFYTQNKFAMASHTFGESNDNVVQSLQKLDVAGLFLTLLMGGLFVLYQVIDRHVEKEFTFIAPEKMTPKAAFFEAGVLIGIPLIASFFFSLTDGVILLLLLFISGYLFNFKPFNWKNNAFLGLLAIIISGGLIFALGWFVNGTFSNQMLRTSIPYVLSTACIYLFLTMLDMQNETSEKKTFAQTFGSTVTVLIALLLAIIALILSLNSGDELIFYPTFFSLPFLIWVGLKFNQSELERVIKYPVAMFAISISIKWILTFDNYVFVFILAAVYIASKIFHRLRFGVNKSTLLT